MKARAIVIAALVAVSVIAFGFAWHAARSATQARRALASVASKTVAVRDEIERAKARLAKAEADRANLQSAVTRLSKVDANKTTGATPKPGGAVTGATLVQMIERIDKDPAVQTLRIAAKRADLARRYGPLFRRLKLSPAQIQQFQAIATKQSEQTSDLYAVARAQGLPYTDPAVTTMQRQFLSEYGTAQRALLGDEGYSELQDYERTSNVREIVSGFAGVAVLEGSPISADQAEAMTRVLAESTESYREGGWAAAQSVDWVSADAQIRALLTDAQFVLFQTTEFFTPAGGRFRAQMQAAFERAKKEEAEKPQLSPELPSGG